MISLKSRFSLILLFVCAVVFSLSAELSQAADPPSAVGSMLNLLKSGRVPESRLGTIVKLICDRGNEHDLRFIYDQVLADEWPAELKQSALSQLSEASAIRNVQPAGDLSSLVELFQSDNVNMQQTAIELAGRWKVESALDALKEMVVAVETESGAAELALAAMAKISPQRTEAILVSLATNRDSSFNSRATAISVLTTTNIEQASQLAIQLLKDAGERDDPAELLNGFLDQEKGSKVLAESLKEAELKPDTAKLALRHMYSIGRADQELSNVLQEIAGIAGDPKVPTPEELKELVKVVNETGDAARGELVFRRNDLSCMKCHAVSKAGGQIGPDLSAIGASSPVEYVIMSVLDPDQAIKEAYTTRVVITVEGRIHQGIVADRTANALVLKDATGKETSIPIDDIDDEVEGKSLMPKGLVKFMTQAEFIDLAKFLATLGKPGDYGIRTTQRMQRWRLLNEAPDGLIAEVPTLSTFEDLVLRSNRWEAVSGKVNGELPLSELVASTDQPIVYVYGELDVSSAGKITGNIESPEGLTIWVDDQQIEAEQQFEVELEAGVHRVTFRVDTTQRVSEFLKLEFTKPAGSEAAFNVVDGQ